MKKRVIAQFNGTVQGVGFRFTTQRIARQYDVVGYVRNLTDGKVEVLAEGEENVVRDFLQAIRQSSLEHYIRESKQEWLEAEGNFKEFGLSF